VALEEEEEQQQQQQQQQAEQQQQQQEQGQQQPQHAQPNRSADLARKIQAALCALALAEGLSAPPEAAHGTSTRAKRLTVVSAQRRRRVKPVVCHWLRERCCARKHAAQAGPRPFEKPSPIELARLRIPHSLQQHGAVLLNAQGHRFVNELASSEAVATAIVRLPERRATLLLDAPAADAATLAGLGSYLGAEVLSGRMRRALGMQAVARELGVSCRALEAEVESYALEEAWGAGRFGKRVFPTRLELSSRPGCEAFLLTLSAEAEPPTSLAAIKQRWKRQDRQLERALLSGNGLALLADHGADGCSGDGEAQGERFGWISGFLSVRAPWEDAPWQPPVKQAAEWHAAYDSAKQILQRLRQGPWAAARPDASPAAQDSQEESEKENVAVGAQATVTGRGRGGRWLH
jgi:hypothetical protein